MTAIKIIAGEFRNIKIENQVFKMALPFKVGNLGYGYVTVQNDNLFDVDASRVRIKVENESMIEYLEKPVGIKGIQNYVAQTIEPEETDEEIMNRIAERFEMLDLLAGAACAGQIRSLVVQGAPGTGKSYGIQKQLEIARNNAIIIDNVNAQFSIIKGTSSAIGLYQLLWRHAAAGSVLVLDDLDPFGDEEMLNLLKACLDSGDNRTVAYNKESRILADAGIPNEFEFFGSVIFITNTDLHTQKDTKIAKHQKALVSRSHMLDLTINTRRDCILRVRQIHRDADVTGGLFAQYELDAFTANEIIDFMYDNMESMNETSVRAALKIADLTKVTKNWRKLALATCCKN